MSSKFSSYASRAGEERLRRRQAEVDAAVREGLKRCKASPRELHECMLVWLRIGTTSTILRDRVEAAWREQHVADSAGGAFVA